ncbi:hypothetical protein GmHk_12G033608 [Glycine max]|nr:hypothetical protein GmHk_12G033608 [Glycine max]
MCNKEGYREDKGLTAKKQKRRPETRCGCKARFQVHIVLRSHLWHATKFKDFHNHELQIGMHSVLVASHRKMDECDIMQMNRLRKAGIDTLDIYNSFASKLGGYLNVQFGKKKNMYNQISRQRRLGGSDGATTYKKNKHRLSIVIFFGVNNHKQTIVFKTPTVVITNGDMTMRNAIRRVFGT